MSTVKTHRFVFVGDVVCHSRPNPGLGLRTVMERAHIACCNFEAPIKGVGAPIVKTGPLIQQESAAPSWLGEMGFNCFCLANNHINDFGPQALKQTMRSLTGHTLLGAGQTAQAYQLQQIQIDGVRYGLLAYGENGYGALNGDRDVGHAWINHPRVNQDIKRYRELVDYLIIQVHAGVELWDIPIPEWRNRYRELIDLGADIVIGHHPHQVHGIEEHRGKPIYYSLGNFYFDAPNSPTGWNLGGVLELELQEGVLKTHRLHMATKDGTRIELLDGTKSSNHLTRLNRQLHHPDYLAHVEQKALLEWEKHHAAYYAGPFNGMSGYSLTKIAKHLKRLLFNPRVNYNMLWHNLFIESNKWLVERVIRKKTGLK
ncbi:MAG: CapA family protein [Sphingobacterium sp.]